jgi:amidase
MVSILDRDSLNAFCRHTHAEVRGAIAGPLAGLNCGIKDIYDIAGFHTGFGSPTWLATHAAATRTASAVQRLLDAGAHVVGKTHTDELTFSLAGENAHYGTPVNPNAPGCIPGGSSSGSAAATAGGLVDFALGSDTGGSVRGPASLCGVFGMRPTHGRIPLDGACPLAPSMDTAGWFARDATLLQRVGQVIFATPAATTAGFSRLLIAEDAFETVEAVARPALDAPASRLAGHFGHVRTVRLSAKGLADWVQVFRPLQGAEIWAGMGEWVRTQRPQLGPGIKERFEWAAAIPVESLPPLHARREAIRAALEDLLGTDGLIVLPTMAGAAPRCGSQPSVMEAFRMSALSLLSIAGLAGLPQISLPWASIETGPLGISLIGPRGSDEQLLAFVAQLEHPPA